MRHIKEAKNAFDPDHKLHTYSIGIKGANEGRGVGMPLLVDCRAAAEAGLAALPSCTEA